MAWLNDGEPKLFRSMTEGNLLVILTDVNLTPNRTLGRRLYNFSATAYEIGDGNSFEDIKKYGVVIIRDDETAERKYDGDSADEGSEDDTVVERIHQYIIGKNNRLATDEIAGVDVINDQLLMPNTNSGG